MVAGKREGSVADSLHCRKVWLHFCWGASQVPANTVSPAQKHESALRLYLASTTTAMSIGLFYAHIAEHKTLAKKPPKRYKQLWQWKSDSKWQCVSILSNIHCGRWLVKCIRHNSEGQRPPKQRRPRLQKWYTLFALSGSTQHCSGSVHGRKNCQ